MPLPFKGKKRLIDELFDVDLENSTNFDNVKALKLDAGTRHTANSTKKLTKPTIQQTRDFLAVEDHTMSEHNQAVYASCIDQSVPWPDHRGPRGMGVSLPTPAKPCTPNPVPLACSFFTAGVVDR